MECYYKAIVGCDPKCDHHCDGCEFYLPVMDGDPTEQDEMPE